MKWSCARVQISSENNEVNISRAVENFIKALFSFRLPSIIAFHTFRTQLLPREFISILNFSYLKYELRYVVSNGLHWIRFVHRQVKYLRVANRA